LGQKFNRHLAKFKAFASLTYTTYGIISQLASAKQILLRDSEGFGNAERPGDAALAE
jgi:hypothetical protein